MSTNIASPERWAREVPPKDLRFADADLYVFKENPRLLEALGRARRDDRKNRRPWWQIVLIIAKVVILLAPVAGFGVFGGPITDGQGRIVGEADAMDRVLAVPIATWSFAIAALGPVILLGEWATTNGRRRDSLAFFAMGGAIVCGTLTLLGLTSNGWVDLFSGATAPIWLTMALAGLVMATIVLFSGGRLRDATKDFPTVRLPNYAKLEELLSGLDEHGIELLLGKRERILKRLRKRGLLDEAEYEAMVSAPLGTGHKFDSPRAA